MKPKTPKTTKTTKVTAADPRHPKHVDWLKILQLAAAIGPVVVAVASPENANLANQLGGIVIKATTAAEE